VDSSFQSSSSPLYFLLFFFILLECKDTNVFSACLVPFQIQTPLHDFEAIIHFFSESEYL
jgi:hypothetical protein